jgi:hypothetical protein
LVADFVGVGVGVGVAACVGVGVADGFVVLGDALGLGVAVGLALALALVGDALFGGVAEALVPTVGVPAALVVATGVAVPAVAAGLGEEVHPVTRTAAVRKRPENRTYRGTRGSLRSPRGGRGRFAAIRLSTLSTARPAGAQQRRTLSMFRSATTTRSRRARGAQSPQGAPAGPCLAEVLTAGGRPDPR